MVALHIQRNTKLVIKQLHSVKSQVKTVRFQSFPEGCSRITRRSAGKEFQAAGPA